MKLDLIYLFVLLVTRWSFRSFRSVLFIRTHLFKYISKFIVRDSDKITFLNGFVVMITCLFAVQQASAAESDTGYISPDKAETELIIIDPAVHDPYMLYQALNAKFKQHLGQNHKTEIVFLKPELEPLLQIRNAIKDKSNLSQLSIVSHASNGALFLSGRWVDKKYIDQQALLMSEIGISLKKGADLKLYGCNLASGGSGKKFINRVAELTQLDVAASTDTTGGVEQGHNWELEYQVGNIDTRSLFSEALPTFYSSTLNHFRYGTMAVEPIAGESGKVRLKVQIGYTLDHNIMNKLVNSAVGTINCDKNYLAGFTWGDGQGEANICVQLLSKDSATNDSLVEIVSQGANGYEPGIVHQYQADGDYTLSWDSYARSPAMSQDNSYWRGELTTSVVNGEVTNASPVTAVSALVYVRDDHLFTMQVSGVDQDGDKIQYRWGEKREFYSGNSGSQVKIPTGMQLSAEGLITWDLAADKANGDLVTYTEHTNPSTVTSNRWQAAIVLEDLDINGVVKSKAPLDFVFVISDPDNASPGFNPGPEITATQYIQLHQTTTFTLSASDVDENGDPDIPTLSVLNPPSTDPAIWSTSIVSQDPATGTSVIEVTFTPSDEMLGKAYAVIFSAKDSNGISSEASVNLVIVNEAPIAQDDAGFTQQGEAITLDVLSNDSDPDGDPLTITQYNAPNGTVVLNADSTITYTPDTDFSGLETISYVISDGIGSVASANILVTVNASPVAVDDAFNINEDTITLLDLLDNDSDPDDDALAITLTAASSGQLSLVNNIVTYTPNADFYGTDSFSYIISDGLGGSDTASVSLTVLSVNDAPIANADTASVDEDSSLNYAVLDNDSDLENHTLTVSVTQPDHGQASVEADGSINYVPDADFNGSDAITYTINDGHGGQDSALLSVTVNAVNDNPIAVNDSATLDEDASVSIPVLLNDTDIDGDSLTVTVQGASSGSVSVTAFDLVLYTPNANFNGSDSFSYSIDDGNGGTASATISVLVTSINDTPLALNDAVTLDEDTSVTVQVLQNDSDLDNDLLVVTAQSPAHGQVTIGLDGSIHYTPEQNFYGVDSLTYTLDDGHGGTAQAQLSIIVEPINDLPIALDDYASVEEDLSVTIDLLANDSDVDNDELTLILELGAHGELVELSGGSVRYTPDVNYNGSDTINYHIEDGNGGQASAVVTIDIVSVNDKPVAENDLINVNEDTSLQFNLLHNDSDVEFSLNPASAILIDSPEHMSASVENGVVTLTPIADFNGSDMFSYQVSDAEGEVSNIASVSITVAAVNDAPRPQPDFANVDEDIILDIAVLENDIDIDDADSENSSIDIHSVAIVQAPLHGQLVDNEGVLSYQPDSNYVGPDSFSYTVADMLGAISPAVDVTLNVEGINDAPVAVGDSTSTKEDQSISFTLTDNDTDLDSTIDTDSVVLFSAPAHGVVSISEAGEVSYTPSADFFGNDSFSYTVKDNEGAVSLPGNVNISVTSVNDAPRLQDDIAELVEDGVNDINVLGNDSDVDGQLVLASLRVITEPEHGSVSVLPSGLLRYIPDENYYGPDSFSYQIEDNQAASSQAQVQISIDSINDKPLVQDDLAVVDEDSAATINILANDSDLDGSLDISSVVILSMPAYGELEVNSDGSVDYTPNRNFNGSDGFSYQVSDDSGAISSPALVFIEVNAVNDSPEISGSPATQVLQGEGYQFVPVSLDIDNDTLAFSISGLPVWATFTPETGMVSGSPEYQDVGDYGPIVISVTDGLETVTLESFYIEVVILDSDGDGIPDAVELELGLDPFDGSDAAGDADGDGMSNYDEWLAGTDLYIDDVAPELIAPADIWLDAIGLFTQVDLGTAQAYDYIDGVRQACCQDLSHSMVSDQPLLKPGSYQVLWTAIDAAGNMSEQLQNIYVRPLISLAQDQIVSQGNRVSVSVHLNGLSSQYPLTVAYKVGGNAVEGLHHDLNSGVVVFESGQIAQTLEFNTFDIEQNEQVSIHLDDQFNLGSKKEHYVTITLDNLAPEVQLSSYQFDEKRTWVAQVDGAVEIKANYTDPNSLNSHTLDWSLTDSELQDVQLFEGQGVIQNVSQSGVNGSKLETWYFDPSGLVEGVYTVRVTVTDDGVPNLSHFNELRVRVSEQLPVLTSEDSDGDGVTDIEEGLVDSDGDGIPDYLDPISAGNVLPERIANTESYLVECESGIDCRLGQYAMSGVYLGAQVAGSDIQANLQGIAPGGFVDVGGVFNIEAIELSEHSQVVSIVIPQRNPVPEHSGYRHFIHDKGWFTFDTNGDNQLMSAPGSAGYCPPPGSDEYSEGLNQGDWCLQLIILDGGVNDADEIANGAVSITGCLIQEESEPVTTETDTSVEVEILTEGGGASSGGSMQIIILYLLLVTGLFRNQTLNIILLLNKQLLTHKHKYLHRLAYLPLFFFVSVFSLNATATAADNESGDDELVGWFISGLYGQSQTSEGTSDINTLLADAELTAEVIELDSSTTGWKLGIGYAFTANWSATLEYVDLGEVSVRIKGETDNPQAFYAAASQFYPNSAKGVGLNLGYRYQFASDFSVLLHGGLLSWQADYKSYDIDTQQVATSEQDGNSFYGGLGLEYALTKTIRFSVQWSHVELDDTSRDLIGAGMQFLF